MSPEIGRFILVGTVLVFVGGLPALGVRLPS
jgi:hypothetical protein